MGKGEKSKRIERAKNGILGKGFEYFVITWREGRSLQFLSFSFNHWNEVSCGKKEEQTKEERDKENRRKKGKEKNTKRRKKKEIRKMEG